MLLPDEIGLAGDPQSVPERIVRTGIRRRRGNILSREAAQETKNQRKEGSPQRFYGARWLRYLSTKKGGCNQMFAKL